MAGRIIISILIGLLLVTTEARAGERVALVIGNGSYRHVPFLPNPPNDAKDVAGSFARLGFSVTSLTDLTYEGMNAALRDFNQAARGADIAVVFFAGHGMEVGGHNWLIPVDAVLHSDADIDKQAIGLDTVMRSVDVAHFGLIMLDACRDNPFAAVMVQKQAGRAITRGLSRVQPKGNLLVAYAARDGTTAGDGGGRNSPFTDALLHNLETPGLEIGRLFRRVRDTVLRETRGQQQPFTYDGLASRELVYLKPPALGAISSAPDPATECDRLAASPFDKDRPASVGGVEQKKVDGLAALSACEAAVKKHPETARFYFQLGRAAWILKSSKQTRELFAKASDMGSGIAAYDLGLIYLNGLDSEKDEAKARSWLQRGVELGDARAMATLGLVYSSEPGRTDDARAYALFVKAADEDPVAMNSLGFFYETGRQVAQDYATARIWYERAAARGNEVAMRNLGSLYERGAGVSKDLGTARSLYEKAAAAGDRESSMRLRTLK
jgi:TPR repeat protein